MKRVLKRIVLVLLLLVVAFTAISCGEAFKEMDCPRCGKTHHYAGYKSGRHAQCKYCGTWMELK